uniref:glycogen/starch/alpha-glucan phosphorylase n=1 Tax=Streptobacillus moniliformis TaxID=34105 RepID=UPI000AA8CEAC
HQEVKEKLIELVVENSGVDWNAETLTLTWARRIAAYKQPLLIFSDLERLKKIAHNAKKPVQIILAGKAHPGDTNAKEMISQIIRDINLSGLSGSVV